MEENFLCDTSLFDDILSLPFPMAPSPCRTISFFPPCFFFLLFFYCACAKASFSMGALFLIFSLLQLFFYFFMFFFLSSLFSSFSLSPIFLPLVSAGKKFTHAGRESLLPPQCFSSSLFVEGSTSLLSFTSSLSPCAFVLLLSLLFLVCVVERKTLHSLHLHLPPSLFSSFLSLLPFFSCSFLIPLKSCPFNYLPL